MLGCRACDWDGCHSCYDKDRSPPPCHSHLLFSFAPHFLFLGREENAQLVKGSPCWYKKPDGSLVQVPPVSIPAGRTLTPSCQAVIESVDQAHSPPSYIVVVEGSARETERERLLAFLPLAKSVELQVLAPNPLRVLSPDVEEEQQEQEKLRAEETSKIGAEAPEPSS